MRDFAGKTAFVTGGASGIGLAMARAFAEAGMRVMLADIEAKPLEQAVAAFKGNLPEVRGVVCDVRDYAAVERAAQATSTPSARSMSSATTPASAAPRGADNISLHDWRWVIDVNLMGVVHGMNASCRSSRAMARAAISSTPRRWRACSPRTGFGAYTATKFAVVGMSEALATELAPQGIGVSVLCPGWVATRITESRAQLAQGLWRATAALDRADRGAGRGTRSQRHGPERCGGAGAEGDARQ